MAILHVLRDRMRVGEREVAGQLQVERHLGSVDGVDQRQVVELAHVGDGHRRRLDALADLRLRRRRLDVDDDVAFREHALHRVLDAIGRGVALPHGGAG